MLCRLGPVTSLPFGLGSLQLKRLLWNWNLRMERKKEGGDGATQSAEAEAEAEGMKFKPQVYEMRQLLLSSNTHSSSSSSSPPSVAWESCWEQGLTPWDLGQPTPILLHIYRTGTLPKGRALIPGCGAGYDVVAIACPERFVVGLDISDVAIKKATALSSSSPNVDYFTFLTADFFNWNPPELFDLVFDYTFFCAIEPEMRPRWASQIRHLLKPNAELITLIFPISDHTGGPPYKVSVSDYGEVLHPMGFKPVSVVDNELAFGPRKGREKLARWKMPLRQSLL